MAGLYHKQKNSATEKAAEHKHRANLAYGRPPHRSAGAPRKKGARCETGKKRPVKRASS